ncbi:MAG: cupin domain-containing protein [Lachnospiraceae bacterium]|jgi:quercetin dioxygenase-like cupin family protein
MIKKPETVVIDNLQGGKGHAIINHIISKEELSGSGKMYAEVVLEPGCSIGWHQHVDETEPYYILEGEGIFTDNDKSRTIVHPGDVCTIKPGQWHSIENNSESQNLSFMALIYYTNCTRPE